MLQGRICRPFPGLPPQLLSGMIVFTTIWSTLSPYFLCRCSNFLLEADGQVQCVSDCSSGFHITVLPNTTISVRECDVATPPASEALPQWAVILIIVLGVAVIIICVMVGTIFIATVLSRSSQGQFDVEDTNNRDLRRKEAASNTLRTKRSNSFSYEVKGSVSSFSCILYHSSYVLLISPPPTYTKRMNRIPTSLGMKIQHSLVSTFSFSNDRPEDKLLLKGPYHASLKFEGQNISIGS